jgi:hypothetical protein
MSVLSTLALLVTTAAVKSRPKADRIAELEAEIVRLKGDLADARREVAELTLVRDDWRARAEVWRERVIGQYQPQLQQNAQAQQNQAALQQYAAYQNAQTYGQGLQQGLQCFDPEMWCNCVPSRAQVWAARSDGG